MNSKQTPTKQIFALPKVKLVAQKLTNRMPVSREATPDSYKLEKNIFPTKYGQPFLKKDLGTKMSKGKENNCVTGSSSSVPKRCLASQFIDCVGDQCFYPNHLAKENGAFVKLWASLTPSQDLSAHKMDVLLTQIRQGLKKWTSTDDRQPEILNSLEVKLTQLQRNELQ